MRLFVIGQEGQVARSLREVASRSGNIVFGFGARPDLDLLRPASIAKALADFRPDMVVNPAAYTAVDKAESEPDQAFALNRDGARTVAAAAADRGVPVIHLSTDYVFDGKKKQPYSETDTVGPQGVYGRSKLEGELAVAEANPKHIVLRTSWVYAPFGSNFVRTMLRLTAERDRLRVVDDQSGCPTYAPDIAGAIIAIAHKSVGSDWHSKYAGVTNIAGPDVRNHGVGSRRRSFRGPRSGAGALFRLTRSPLPIIPRRRRGRLIPACRAKGWKPCSAIAFDP